MVARHSREGSHVLVLTDNTTVLAYVRNMGGVVSEPCNNVAPEIWDWCESNATWLTLAHIPGVLNTLADHKSRHFADNLEWELSDHLFSKLCKVFGEPTVDLFESRLNNKLPKYVSIRPDPQAWKIDVFTFKWDSGLCYALPLFRLVGGVIQKAVADGARMILITPTWPAQPWAKWLKLGFDKSTVSLMLDSWRPSTKKLYTTYLRKWPFLQ